MTEAAKCWREGCNPVPGDQSVRCSLCGLTGATGLDTADAIAWWNVEMKPRMDAYFHGSLRDGHWVRGNKRGDTYEDVK